MGDGFAAIFWGVITFSLLIVVHEGGHFLAARAFGVKVHEFMIGLPGPAFRIHGKKTTYGVTAIPLGGYVRIAGMEPGPEDPLLGSALAAVTRLGEANAFDLATELGISEADADRLLLTLADWDAIEPLEKDAYRYRSKHGAEEASDPVALLDKARSITYRSLTLPKRIVVLLAGVVLNLLTAVLVFTIALTAVGYWQETMRVEEIAKGSSAAQAGIQVGDKITAIEGDKVGRWHELIISLRRFAPGDTVTVALERDGSAREVEAVLGRREGSNDPLLGVVPEYKHYTPGLLGAFLQSFVYIGLTIQVIAGLFNPATFQATVSQSSSVIGASYMAAEAAKSGVLDYAGLIAGLSLSLGVINLVPIPPLDGGKVLVEALERLRGRPLSRQVSLGISATGAMLLFVLIGYLMYADVVKFIVN